MQDNPSKAGKGTGNKRGGRQGTDRKSRPPPACLSALTKMAAVVPPVVSTEKSQADPLELNQWEQAEEDKGESADSTEKLLSDVD